jgi:ERCC4-related helicase
MVIENLKPREYQQKIFETARKANTLVVLPTGLGKTLIALMLAVERKEKYPLSKILFLAPTRPLAEQHFRTFKENLPELWAELELFTGSVPAQKRKKIFHTAEMVFSTPQCVANDLRQGLYTMHDVSLLVIDEAHRCLKNYDYTKVVDYYKRQSERQKIFGLTASPGSEEKKVKEICKHLDIQEIEVRTRDSPDVKDYLQELKFEKVVVPFPQEFIEIKVLLKRIYDSRVAELRKRNLLFGPANKVVLLQLQSRLARQAGMRNFNAMIGMSLTATAIKVSHALELLETQTLSGLDEYLKNLEKQAKDKKSRAVQKLVKSDEFQAILVSLKDLLEKGVEHPKLEECAVLVEEQFKEDANSKVIIFTQFRETGVSLCRRLNKITTNDGNRTRSSEARVSIDSATERAGIGNENTKKKLSKGGRDIDVPIIRASTFFGQAKKGNTGISQKEQKKVLEKMNSGEINVLVATSIGEEGLDISEVSAVIFYEPIPSAIRKIQRTGRTARLAPGKLFILMTKDTRDIAYHYASTAREKKMYKTIDSVRDEINNGKKDKTLGSFS